MRWVAVVWVAFSLGMLAMAVAVSRRPKTPECETVQMVDDKGRPWVCCAHKAGKLCIPVAVDAGR